MIGAVYERKREIGVYTAVGLAPSHESIAEGRKVVWPSRKEAMQATGMVFVFVAVLALFMWMVDSGLTWLFYDVILGRG